MSAPILMVNQDVLLRLLTIAEAPKLFAVVDANRSYLRQWLPWVDANVSVNESEHFIQTSHQQYQYDQTLNSAVFYQGQFAGMCGQHQIRAGDRSVSIGYWLMPEYAGIGIITASVKRLIEDAFQRLGVNSVRIWHATANHKSRAVIERCDFVYENTMRQGEFLYDHYVDLAQYSILRSEWLALKANA